MGRKEIAFAILGKWLRYFLEGNFFLNSTSRLVQYSTCKSLVKFEVSSEPARKFDGAVRSTFTGVGCLSVEIGLPL